MGLTIHYRLAAPPKTTLAQVHAWLEAARSHALTLQMAEVSEVKHFRGDECNPRNRPRDDEWNWALIQADECWSLGGGRFINVYPVEAVLFRTWPGNGCEEANFGLCRFPAGIDYEGRRIKHRGPRWRWHSFCKTQYASESGTAHFLKCHLAVVSMLDFLDDRGLVKQVSDEGKFFQRRDVQALAQEVGEWNGMMAAFTGALMDALPAGTMEAPMTGHPNFEQLEMQGLENTNPTELVKIVQALSQLVKEQEEEDAS